MVDVLWEKKFVQVVAEQNGSTSVSRNINNKLLLSGRLGRGEEVGSSSLEFLLCVDTDERWHGEYSNIGVVVLEEVTAN